MRVLITGASGFVGRALCGLMLAQGWLVRGTYRTGSGDKGRSEGVEAVYIDSIGSSLDNEELFKDIDVVVHLAARAHILNEKDSDPLAAFRAINTTGTEHLARMASEAGVRRFVFISTVGVNGKETKLNSFKEVDPPLPHNNYSISKFEAERALWQLAANSAMEMVIVRSPLVYGPENPGNFLSLLRAVAKGWPLPLASVNNKRSFIFLGNLIDAIVNCCSNPKATGQLFLVSDGEDISTPELIRRLASALDLPARLFPVPSPLLCLSGKIVGRSHAVESLTTSLTVDIAKISQELEWRPLYTMEQGLKKTAEWFQATCVN